MPDAKAAVKALTEEALNLGSTDNVTALLVPLGPGTYCNCKKIKIKNKKKKCMRKCAENRIIKQW
jgi:hypothetical protein